MSARPTSAVLNELAAAHSRSLAKYLSYALPWQGAGEHSASAVLRQVVADHDYMAERLGHLVEETGAPVDPGEYPMAFTGWHDLGLKFLLSRLTFDEKQRVALIERCLAELALAPYAKAIAEEALGLARGHLESLNELRSATSAA